MPKKVLVVDDTKNIREIVAFMFRSKGYEVLEAADGDEGWKLATTANPDAIVLDAMMPGKTGFEICSGLKADSRFRSIPIIMLTAIAQDTGKTDEYWKQKSGAEDFMSKPFKTQELLARVEKLMGVAPSS